MKTAWLGKLVLTVGVLVVGALVAAGTQQGETPTPTTTRMDAHGDPLPADARRRLGTVRFRQGNWVRDLCLSPDGKTIASVGYKQIRLWDAASGKEVRSLTVEQAGGGCIAVAFSPDGKVLAVCRQVDLLLLDAASGKCLRQLELDLPFSVAFAPVGKTMAVALQSGGVSIVETATGKVQAHWRAQEPGQNSGRTWSVSYSPNGQSLAWGEGLQVVLWDVKTTKHFQCLEHRNEVYALAFSPDGKTLAASDYGLAVTLWDAAIGKRLRSLEGHTSPVTRLAFSPDGKLLASGSGDSLQGKGREPHSLRLWDAATGKELAKLGTHAEGVTALGFSKDGKVLYSGGDMCLRTWDVATRKEIPVGNGHQGWVGGVSYSPDGKSLASCGSDMTVRIWDVTTGKERLVLTGAEATIDAVAFSPDGRKLACGSRNARVLLWDTASGKEIARLKAGENEAKVAFSPDGKLLASASRDGQLVLWDATTAREVRRFPPAKGAEGFMSVAFSPDGKFLATGGVNEHAHNGELSDDLIRLWDVAGGREVRQFVGPRSLMLFSVAFSPDGRFLTSCGYGTGLHLWDVATGRLLKLAGEPYKAARHCTFSPDGWMIVTAGYDQTVRLWETATGQERRRFTGHLGFASAAAFAPDGRTLASGGWDTTVLIWDLHSRKSETQPAKAEWKEREFETLWETLADSDGSRAYLAMLTLEGVSKHTVRFLDGRLRPAKLDRKQIDQLVADLDSDDFKKRTNATTELTALAELAEPALRQALAGDPSAEARRRIEQILDRLQLWTPPPKSLREMRAIEVLEHIATPEARGLLQKLAEGAPQARLTREAKSALKRHQ